MKNTKRLFTAFSNIDTDMISSAAPGTHSKQPAAWKKWLPTAACFALAAVIGVAAWQMNAGDPVIDDQNDHSHHTAAEDTNIASTALTNAEIAVVPRWDEMTLTQKFGEFTVGEERYSSRAAAIDAAKVGEKLGEATSQGFDIYTDATYTASLTYHKITGISIKCALAVRFTDQGDDGYYVYVNSWYRPETLEDLISDLNLRENMTFGDFRATGFNSEGNYETVRFQDPDDQIVWDHLLSDTTLKNVYNQTAWYGSILSVSVDIPLLGYENISLWLTEDGHLVTNILDTGKAFFIGEESVQEFLLYVVTHCTDREVTVTEINRDTSVSAGADIERSTPAYDPSAPQTAVEQTTAAPGYTSAPYNPAEQVVITEMTTQWVNPQITTSEE